MSSTYAAKTLRILSARHLFSSDKKAVDFPIRGFSLAEGDRFSGRVVQTTDFQSFRFQAALAAIAVGGLARRL
jgi:hypothetical protein